MSNRAPTPRGTPASTYAAGPESVPGPLRWGVHLLVVALLALGAGRAALAEPANWPVVATCSVVALVYVVGAGSKLVAKSAGAAGTWLTLLLTAWVGLLVLTPDAIYLAFPWFFLLLYLMPRPVGLAAVFMTTLAAVAGFGWHQDKFTAAMVIGPVLGAAVAIVTVFGYQAVQAESEERRRLIVELDRTRTELAQAQHRAGVLDERERLAREIHDTLAQGLTSIQLLLTAANRALSLAHPANGQRASELVEQARLTAQENLHEARRFVRALAPSDLQESTLPAALERLCDTTTTRTGIPVAFHEIGQVPTLPTPVEVALLRIAQAALSNVAQHARADRADVTLTGMDATVTLDVVDDGTGFDTTLRIPATPASPDEGGFGLRSMRSRAADLGGVLSVESQPGRGTAVSVHFEQAPDAPAPRNHTPTPATRLRR